MRSGNDQSLTSQAHGNKADSLTVSGSRPSVLRTDEMRSRVDSSADARLTSMSQGCAPMAYRQDMDLADLAAARASWHGSTDRAVIDGSASSASNTSTTAEAIRAACRDYPSPAPAKTSSTSSLIAIAPTTGTP